MIRSVVLVPELYGEAQIGPKVLKMQEHCQLVSCGSGKEDLSCPVTLIGDELSASHWIVPCTWF